MSHFVINEPTFINGTETMSHNHPPGHDCSQCANKGTPKCHSYESPLLPPEGVVNRAPTASDRARALDYLPPPEPVVNRHPNDEQSSAATDEDLRHPSRLFNDEILPPSAPLVDRTGAEQ